MFFHHLLFNLLISELILFFRLMAFAQWLMSLSTGITSGFFSWGGCNTNGSRKKDLIVIITQWMCFSLLPYKFLGVFTKKLTTFFIDVLTWHGQQMAPKALFCHFYILFINKECRWHYKKCRLPPS
jgi:hypothetical protein